MKEVLQSLQNVQEIIKESISVEYFYQACKNRFKLSKLTDGDIGLDKIIKDRNIHRPGLALAGYTKLFTFERVQILGNTEVRYLKHLSKKERSKVLRKFFSFDIPCVCLTFDNKPTEEFMELAVKNNTAVFISPLPTTKFAYFISDFLDDQFSPQIALHGSFVDVYGVGLLFYGRSGIGKSEIALDLIERGHRLVSDDVVMISRKGEGILMGSGTDLVKHFMEIRGLGIIDVRSIFGIRAIRFQKRVELIVNLEEWSAKKEYTRTGLDESLISVLGVEIPFIRLPIFPGKNITVISEVIALNYLCKHYGYDAAKTLSGKLDDALRKKYKQKTGNVEFERSVEYLEHDFE
ncbi:MAG: HPr kinase/phosphorylase [Ignavibacteriae bacterium]|nr:MAG: HPr kinase/phosphorylase [Ignavibacteriota bacterium]